MASKLLIVALVCLCLVASLDAKPKKKKAPKRRVAHIVRDMEKNMTLLWQKVDYLSQPVHIHVHGDADVGDDDDVHHDHRDEHSHEYEMDDHYAHCHGLRHDHSGLSEEERTAHYAHCHGVAHDHDQAHGLDRQVHDHRRHGHDEGQDYEGHTHDKKGHSHAGKGHGHDHIGHDHPGRAGRKGHDHSHEDEMDDHYAHCYGLRHDHNGLSEEERTAHYAHCHGVAHDHDQAHGLDRQVHDHRRHGHEEGRDYEGHMHDKKGHSHAGKGHDHDHKGHDHPGRAGKKGHDHKGHDRKDTWDNMPRGNGDHHDHHEDHDEHHDKKNGNHVHIHLHTAFEKIAKLMERRMGMMGGHDDHDMEEYRYATCDVVANPILSTWERQAISGTIHMRQKRKGKLQMKIDLTGFDIDRSLDERVRYLRGFHGHMYGTMRYGCASMGGHFNPSGKDHGAPGEHKGHRHPGDFGNMKVSEDGKVDMEIEDNDASLFGDNSFLGRGIVIHEAADDLGMGGDEGSKKTGNAGGRIACCVIIASGKPDDAMNIWSP